jgi:hypothetical protein
MTLEERIKLSEELIKTAREKGCWTLPCLLAMHKTLLEHVLPAEVNNG